jgi:hypothetical protein
MRRPNGGSYCGLRWTRNPTAEWLARQITEAFPGRTDMLNA